MAWRIRLLGRPAIEDDQVTRRLGGRKPWALLCYLLLESRRPTRRELADRLWPEAGDPLAAERWALLQVRRAISPGCEIEEMDGRLVLRTSPDLIVDAHTLLAGRMEPSDVDDLVAGDLLEGYSFDDAPALEGWLMLQRARVASAASDALRWAATVQAHREPERALRLAERALAASPFDDSLHELVVDIHMSRGDRKAARAHVERVDREYRRELGIGAPETVRRPLERPVPPSGAPLLTLDITARALLDSAQGRLEAGDYDGALEAARRAASDAAASGDRALEGRALLSLAGALIHTLRGRDHESLGLLARALQLANDVGDLALAADVEREVGYVALLYARYGAAEAALARSLALANEARDQIRAARATIYLALSQSDRGDFESAEPGLRLAIDLLEGNEDQRWQAYARAVLARILARTHRPGEAREVGEAAIAQARASGWLSLVPWPMTHVGEAALLEEDEAGAEAWFGQAYTLGCEIGDPCWEGLSLRGLALLEARRGDTGRARQILEDALGRCRRFPDTWKWAEAAILTDLVELEGGTDQEHLAAASGLVFHAPMEDFARRLLAVIRDSQTPLQTPSR
ncbi:MAG: hypothetical protein ACRDHS_02565 [Actinomycetota bacterium]